MGDLQESKLEVPTTYFWGLFFRPIFEEIIPTKYGQKYGTVPPFWDPEIPIDLIGESYHRPFGGTKWPLGNVKFRILDFDMWILDTCQQNSCLAGEWTNILHHFTIAKDFLALKYHGIYIYTYIYMYLYTYIYI